MSVMSKLKKQRIRRGLRIRKNLRKFHNNTKLRVSVYRSLKYTSAQVIDDVNGNTILSISTKKMLSIKEKINKVDAAYSAGLTLGKNLLVKDYKEVIFDRGSYLYHGRVKAFADGLRAAGMQI